MGTVIVGFLSYAGKAIILAAIAVVGFISGKKLKEKKTMK